jgi:uncharacterized iron-regulated protein
MDARLRGVMLCLALSLGACASGVQQARQGGEHPLAGEIYRVADGITVSEAELVDDAAGAEFVLIGERHDNPEHHRVQARLVAALEAQSEGPRAVAFEMIPAWRQLEIVEYLAADG